MQSETPLGASDPRRWARMTALLSLDMALPYYVPMELSVGDPEDLAAVMRDVVTREMLVDPLAVTPVGFPEKMVREVAGALGTAEAETLAAWATHVLVDFPAERPGAYAWSTVLRFASVDPRRWAALQLPSSDSDNALASYREAAGEDLIAELNYDQRRNSMTDWDDRIMRSFTFFSEESPPSTWIAGTIRHARFRRALTRIVRRLTEPTLARFRAGALALARQHSLTALDELPDPREVVANR
jgi:hypothetical protein